MMTRDKHGHWKRVKVRPVKHPSHRITCLRPIRPRSIIQSLLTGESLWSLLDDYDENGQPKQVREVVSETFPIRKLTIRADCKYCYRTHRQWWLLEEGDEDDPPVMLCGYCEYASPQEAVEEDSSMKAEQEAYGTPH